MGSSTRIIRAVLLAAAAAVLAAAAYQLREKHQEADLAVQNIHDQLDALDPATRAAVVARLTSEEVKKSATTVSNRGGVPDPRVPSGPMTALRSCVYGGESCAQTRPGVTDGPRANATSPTAKNASCPSPAALRAIS
jgi:hypothetical protein